MKRFRVSKFYFDTRANVLKTDGLSKAKQKITESVRIQYGNSDLENKVENLKDLEALSPSVLRFLHTPFIEIQESFIIGAYYPALTGVCCLGESILNHLISVLKKEYKISEKFNKYLKKEAITNWDAMISELEEWDALLPNVVSKFKKLKKVRNTEGVHFNLNTHVHTRKVALKAINLMRDIIIEQFGILCSQPWIIEGTRGCFYIKKEYEDNPFVKLIYLPNCILVGPLHEIETHDEQLFVNDEFEYIDKDLSDEEFAEMVNNPDKYRDLILKK